MPNWCLTEVCIYGDEEQLKQFCLDFTKNNVASYSNIIPEPFKFIVDEDRCNIAVPLDENEDSEYTKKVTNKKDKYDWYRWRIDNWGVKWDISSENVTETVLNFIKNPHDRLYFCFYSPWCSPISFFDNIYKKYPKLIFIILEKEPSMGVYNKYKFSIDGVESTIIE